jgi:hypothetical protein
MRIFEASSIRYTPAAAVPSMLSVDERALYYDIARTQYCGEGAVVELGTWLGSGTYEICRGLAEAGYPWELTVMDRFLWSEFYAVHYAQPGLAAGDSFLPAFLEYLAPYRDKIKPIVGELSDIGSLYASEAEIELLFVDAPKSWRMLWRVLEHLGGRFGACSQLVFQDFFHVTSRQLIWLLMSVPQLTLTTSVKAGTTAVFEASGPITDLASAAPRDMKLLTPDDLVALWGRLQSAFPAHRLAELAVGMALDLMDRGALEPASGILQAAVVETPHKESVVREVQRLIKKADGERQRLGQIQELLVHGTALRGEILSA